MKKESLDSYIYNILISWVLVLKFYLTQLNHNLKPNN